MNTFSTCFQVQTFLPHALQNHIMIHEGLKAAFQLCNRVAKNFESGTKSRNLEEKTQFILCNTYLHCIHVVACNC